MKTIAIQATKDTPYVYLDANQKKFEIGGKSIPEDADTFYAPIISWWLEYARSPQKETIFKVSLEYLNTVSTRKMLEMLKVIEKIKGAGIVWSIYSEEDKADIQTIADGLKIPFKFVNVE
jgi:hypothetical protein